jgi:hypothetical protein
MSIQVTSNFDDVLIDIERDLADALKNDIPNMLNDISVGLLRTMKRRIHTDGMTVNQTSIGDYDTTPMYVNPNRGAVKVALANKGKHGQTKFANGKDHKTRYYSDGYRGWRKANRRNTDKVNLFFKGDLDRSFTFQKLDDTTFSIGFSDRENWDKARGLEQHFNADIWGVGERENEIIKKTIDAYLKKL